jgi:hypothetical protein
MELVAKPELIVIHVSDHGKPMKLTSATGKVTVFNGNDKTEAPLALIGDKLEAKGSFKLGRRRQGAGRRCTQRQAGSRRAVHAEVGTVRARAQFRLILSPQRSIRTSKRFDT